ncbi:Bug family tripartite tricarboxylate transporter substrate binding protein [Pigmentiphaga litoralis]|uniref:Bug family tripartite tricarboxylate transporter substrate binding protein n=1 Tax=Pigmentiphaga litoralis TaxID=516702 RepID=UPI003B43CE1A
MLKRAFSLVPGLCLTIALTLGLTAGLTPAPARAADAYPDRPVRLVVPYTPGGNTDLLARIIAQKLGEAWKQSVVVENRAGAAGTIGVDLVAKSKPDGYTIVLGTFGNILTAPGLYKNLPYDAVKDLAPIILLAEPATALVVHPGVPANSVTELIAYAKAHPGALNYGSSGSGSSNHLFGALFASMANVKMTHVPYKGSGPAVNDLVGGMIQVSFAPFPLVLEQIKAGKLKALAVTGATRSPALPQVPTVAEAGLKGYEAIGWFALMAPAGTPRSILSKLNTEVDRILKTPEVRASLAAEGADPVGGSIDDAARSITEGVRKWGTLVQQLDITL